MTLSEGRFYSYNEPIGQHYSNKGGHKARSDFWKMARRGGLNPSTLPLDQQWLIRRNMFRDPRSGK